MKYNDEEVLMVCEQVLRLNGVAKTPGEIAVDITTAREQIERRRTRRRVVGQSKDELIPNYMNRRRRMRKS